MKNRMKWIRLAALVLLMLLAAGCTAPAQAEQGSESTLSERAAVAAEQPEESGGSETSRVADASQMTAVEDVVEDGMSPVYAAELVDGVYPVSVSSSSSMFKIADCELTVSGGAMTAKLTMSSTSYGWRKRAPILRRTRAERYLSCPLKRWTRAYRARRGAGTRSCGMTAPWYFARTPCR